MAEFFPGSEAFHNAEARFAILPWEYVENVYQSRRYVSLVLFEGFSQ